MFERNPRVIMVFVRTWKERKENSNEIGKGKKENRKPQKFSKNNVK